MQISSFIFDTYENVSFKSLVFLCFSLRFDFVKFYFEVTKLKNVLYKNSYQKLLYNYQKSLDDGTKMLG